MCKSSNDMCALVLDAMHPCFYNKSSIQAQVTTKCSTCSAMHTSASAAHAMFLFTPRRRPSCLPSSTRRAVARTIAIAAAVAAAGVRGRCGWLLQWRGELRQVQDLARRRTARLQVLAVRSGEGRARHPALRRTHMRVHPGAGHPKLHGLLPWGLLNMHRGSSRHRCSCCGPAGAWHGKTHPPPVVGKAATRGAACCCMLTSGAARLHPLGPTVACGGCMRDVHTCMWLLF